MKPGKPRQFNYSAQTSVDTQGHVITNILADFSDKRDSQSLPQAVAQTRENLAENNLKMEEVIADTGYSSGTALRYLKENHITGYIPNFGQYKPTREGFTYDKENNNYVCSQGKILKYAGVSTDRRGYETKNWNSKTKDCRDCPLKSTCIGKSKFKRITENIDKPLYDEMHLRLQTRKAKYLKKQRSSTVEPVLGTLINFTGMRRVYTRGIKNANKFMLGAATAYNIKKWLNYKEKKVNIKVQELPKPEKQAKQSLLNFFFCFYTCLNYHYE